MGQVNLVRIGQKYINDNGSFTLTTGILVDEPIVGSAAGNDGYCGGRFVLAASQELPRGIRINVICPTEVEDSVGEPGDAFAGFTPASMERL
jgi:hypothetical protein